MRRIIGTLAICTAGIAACDTTEPDACGGTAQGDLEVALYSNTAGRIFGTRETMFVGDTLTLTVWVTQVESVSPGGGLTDLCEVSMSGPIPTTIEWSSSSARVATVSATGVIVGREAGDAVITARAPALGVSASLDIAVRVRGT